MCPNSAALSSRIPHHKLFALAMLVYFLSPNYKMGNSVSNILLRTLFMSKIFPVLPGSPVVKTPYRVCVCVCVCVQPLVETWGTRETRILHAMWHSQKKKKIPFLSWEFPSGPVVRTLCFHCHGPGFDLVGELRSHKLQRGQSTHIYIDKLTNTHFLSIPSACPSRFIWEAISSVYSVNSNWVLYMCNMVSGILGYSGNKPVLM